MIPADLASQLRLVTQQELTTQPRSEAVAPVQKIAEVLSDLSVGQRVLAEIQALLPNGTYRAVVAQRDVTLALPFSAKPGDTLELEVTETDGKITFAFVANKTEQQAQADEGTSVTTRLSRTGDLIGQLMGEIDQQGGKAPAANLNGTRPIIENPQLLPSELAPRLKEALVKSGVFYEAHQAQWVAGKLPTQALLQEPQGQMSPLLLDRALPTTPAPPVAAPETSKPLPTAVESDKGQVIVAKADSAPEASPSSKPLVERPETSTASSNRETLVAPQSMGIPKEVAPIVQQQLNALATQNFAWEGLAWPGQPMRWEIQEEGHSGQPRSNELEAPRQWQTRVRLDLPVLGGIDALIRFDHQRGLSLHITANNADSTARIESNTKALTSSMQEAGLSVSGVKITHGELTN